MCLGVPGKVVAKPKAEDALAMASVEFAGIRRPVCLACVPEAEPGDFVIVHAGFAISRIDPEEAQRVFAHLREIDEAEGWTATDATQMFEPALEKPPDAVRR